MNCKLRVLDSCPLWLKHGIVAAYVKKMMHDRICGSGVSSREIIHTFSVSQMSGLVESFSTWDTL